MLYHFAIFIIINKILIVKNWRKLVFNNFYSNINFTKELQKSKIFYFLFIELYEFFQNFLINFLMYFFIFTNIRKYGIKKFLKNYKKIFRAQKKINNCCLLQFFCKVNKYLTKKLLKTNFRQFLAINILLIIKKIAKW